MSKISLSSAAREKLNPKLQMFCNGSEEVNSTRAETCSGLICIAPAKQPSIFSSSARSVALSKDKRVSARKKLKSIPSNVEANVFVQLNRIKDSKPVLGEIARRGYLVRAKVKLSELPTLATDERVAYVELGEALKPPRAKLSKTKKLKAPSVTSRKFGKEAEHKFGKDVLIGIIDVDGFDFSHDDFLNDDGTTRFVAIWDQAGDARPSPTAARFNFGAEFRAKQLNAAIKAAPNLKLPAYEIELQTEINENSHGTHVASIAAGNRGVCRKAAIAGVLLSLHPDEEKRHLSFADSTRISDAVDYLVELAKELKFKAVSINISLGTNGHAHDGSHPVGRWIDSALSVSGRSVTVAAGNAGQEKPEADDEEGWMLGRVHTSGKIQAAGLKADIEWVVVGDGVIDVSENELEIWYSAQDRFAISVRTPSGEWSEIVEPREFIENKQLSNGCVLSIYNQLYHPANGANYLSIYLSPNMESRPPVGVSSGKWIVRLHGREIRDGKYDGWIERDDPMPNFEESTTSEEWYHPSFFSERTMVDKSTVNSLGCCNRTICVANYDEGQQRINASSSQGPTRDGRTKPDIAAPGTEIVAANGFAAKNEPWVAMTGTSMAAPFVTGVVGLMLAIEPQLTAAQIEGILRSTAKPLPGASFAWIDDAGFGVIDPEHCLKEAALIYKRVELR